MTTETATRATSGGFEDRFTVVRNDGKVNIEARYLVLDYSGRDPHAIPAIKAYADSIESDNPQMAANLRDALENPQNYPHQNGSLPRGPNGQ
jgi:hypothetical protein